MQISYSLVPGKGRAVKLVYLTGILPAIEQIDTCKSEETYNNLPKLYLAKLYRNRGILYHKQNCGCDEVGYYPYHAPLSHVYLPAFSCIDQFVVDTWII